MPTVEIKSDFLPSTMYICSYFVTRQNTSNSLDLKQRKNPWEQPIFFPFISRISQATIP